MSIDFPLSFEPSPALLKVAALYERYFQTATSVPYDEGACESAFLDWKDAMEAVFPGGVVVPKTVVFPQPRPPGVTDEEIAEVWAAVARGYWPMT